MMMVPAYAQVAFGIRAGIGSSALVQKIEDLQNDVENLKYNIVDFNGVCY